MSDLLILFLLLFVTGLVFLVLLRAAGLTVGRDEVAGFLFAVALVLGMYAWLRLDVEANRERRMRTPEPCESGGDFRACLQTEIPLILTGEPSQEASRE